MLQFTSLHKFILPLESILFQNPKVRVNSNFLFQAKSKMNASEGFYHFNHSVIQQSFDVIVDNELPTE